MANKTGIIAGLLVMTAAVGAYFVLKPKSPPPPPPLMPQISIPITGYNYTPGFLGTIGTWDVSVIGGTGTGFTPSGSVAIIGTSNLNIGTVTASTTGTITFGISLTGVTAKEANGSYNPLIAVDLTKNVQSNSVPISFLTNSQPSGVDPVIDSNVNTVTPGMTITIVGGGFSANKTATLIMSANATVLQTWTVQIDSSGASGSGTGGFTQANISPPFSGPSLVVSFQATDNATGLVSAVATVTDIDSGGAGTPNASNSTFVIFNGSTTPPARTIAAMSPFPRVLVFNGSAYTSGPTTDAWVVSNSIPLNASPLTQQDFTQQNGLRLYSGGDQAYSLLGV